jgi:hypothetical protein
MGSTCQSSSPEIEPRNRWAGVYSRDFAIGCILEKNGIQGCRVISFAIAFDWVICDGLDVNNLIASVLAVGWGILSKVLSIYK